MTIVTMNGSPFAIGAFFVTIGASGADGEIDNAILPFDFNYMRLYSNANSIYNYINPATFLALDFSFQV
jgi:hypothetical protein